ncbi:Fis family transcriptional regulator [Leifsonia sp. ku-ls]|nr:Fis family transcriptional regulator [Leifsonia sp. ku-ls]
MSRPKQAQDPVRFPEPCARCGEHRRQAARWPDGCICQNCYRAAHRTTGVCALCGHDGILPGVNEGQATCRSCSGIRLNLDCRRCGAEAELYSHGQCWSCTLADLVDQALTDPRTRVVPPQLIPLADGLKSMKRANSGLTWIRQKHVQEFLAHLAATGNVTHQQLDALPESRTRNFVRGLLVEHEVLPRRDHYLALFDRWASDALDRVENPRHRDIIKRYVRWQHLRRMNQMHEVPRGTFLRSKQATTVAIEFLNWLTDHGILLDELQQAHLDAWANTGPTTRLIAGRFLRWAVKTRQVARDLRMAEHRRGTAPRMNFEDQDHATHRVVHTDELTARDRAIGILVLVFGQQIEKIVQLSWDDLTVTEETVTIRIGAIDIALPSPLDEPWRRLAADPGNGLTAAHPNTPWIFRGISPGQPLNAHYVTRRLKHVFAARAARLGTLHELSKLGPVPIIAEALGYSPTTIERHRIDSAAAYSQYIAGIRGS